MPLPSAILLASAVLTFGAFLTLSAKAGPGLLLYVAMLGGSAVWLLPGLLAQALPLGLFGGTLVAAASRPTNDRIAPAQLLMPTVLIVGLCLGLTGWMVPEGYRVTAAAAARFTGGTESASDSLPAPALDLPSLVAAGTPAARSELGRRLLPVTGCALAGLVAAVLLAVGIRLPIRAVVVLTLALFVAQMTLWARTAP